MANEHDTYFEGSDGKLLASFGPRRLYDAPGQVELCSPEMAEFWSVFSYDSDGYDEHVGDAVDKESAAAFAGLIADAASRI
jgi:hypothetical protein